MPVLPHANISCAGQPVPPRGMDQSTQFIEHQTPNNFRKAPQNLFLFNHLAITIVLSSKKRPGGLNRLG